MYIGRRLDNSLYGFWTTRQRDDADHPRQEEVDDDHPDVLAYNAPRSQDERAISAIDGLDRLQFIHLFELENRVRVLEGKAPITVATYRQALIDRWKTLNA